jgi:hypothetical protein
MVIPAGSFWLTSMLRQMSSPPSRFMGRAPVRLICFVESPVGVRWNRALGGGPCWGVLPAIDVEACCTGWAGTRLVGESMGGK